jgi:hypothetical protein
MCEKAVTETIWEVVQSISKRMFLRLPRTKACFCGAIPLSRKKRGEGAPADFLSFLGQGQRGGAAHVNWTIADDTAITAQT